MTRNAARRYLLTAVLLVMARSEPLCALTLDEFSACVAWGAGSDASSKPYQLNLSGPKRPWLGMLGFNPSFIAADHRAGNFQGQSFGHLMDLLTPQALRFPPGTYASFYDWDTQSIDESLAREFANKAMVESARNQRKRNQGDLIKSDYHSFLSLVNERSLDPFIVLNMLTKDSDDAEQTIAKVRKKLHGPVNWELGNEVSNVEYLGAGRQSPWNVDVYTGRVGVVSEFIRNGNPQDKIGIVGAELLKERGHIHVPGWIEQFSLNWARRMSREAVNYDAVIFHPYINLVDDVIEAGMYGQRSIAECSVLDQESRRAIVQYQWVFSAAQEVPRAYDAYADFYYPNKQLWLTEVGLFGEKAVAPLNFSANGVLRALFNIVYFAHWLDKVPNLRAYMFHVLDYGIGDFAALYPDRSLNANSVSYMLLHYLLDGATDYSVQVLDQNGRLHGVGPYHANSISPIVALIALGPSGVRVLVVNLGLSVANMKSPFDAVEIRMLGGSPSSSIASDELYSLDDLPSTTTTDQVLKLPPMSLILIESM